MPTTLGSLVNRVRDALQDPSGGSAHWTDARLQQAVNDGIGALWPRVYSAWTDTSLTTVAGETEYTLPADVPLDAGFSTLRRVELAAATANVAGATLYGWRVDVGRGVLVLSEPVTAGRTLRLEVMLRYESLGSDALAVWQGPVAAEMALLAYAVADVLGEERRTSLRDEQHLGAARGVRADEMSAFERLLRPGGGIWMQPLPLVR